MSCDPVGTGAHLSGRGLAAVAEIPEALGLALTSDADGDVSREARRILEPQR